MQSPNESTGQVDVAGMPASKVDERELKKRRRGGGGEKEDREAEDENKEVYKIFEEERRSCGRQREA